MATKTSKIEEFYKDCMNCPNTPKICKGILKDSKAGYVPRGFFFKSPSVEILVVGKNPGHPLPGERDKYKGKKDFELFNEYRKHQMLYEDLKNLKDRSLIFHKNLFRYLSRIRGINNDSKTIYQYYAHTNLVKCSTIGEQDKLKKETIEICYKKYFSKEIEFFKPKIILALGREVEKYLLKKIDDHKIPHIIYIKHPSRPMSKEVETKVLLKIKKQVDHILRKN